MSLKNLSAKTKIPKLLKEKLNNKRIKQIYRKFERSLKIDGNFLVAVSGGPDSLALAFLSRLYSVIHHKDAKFFIIDHKLRPESTAEANNVKKILKKNLIYSKILTLEGKKPTKNVQALARKRRYELLFSMCKKFKINNILLGHHQDDLFENFFIRMSRGSGLKGLISLNKISKSKNINLIRPLLDHKKDDLIFISKNVFNFYVKDPSNEDMKFQRIKIRNLINNLEKEGLTKSKFLMTIRNLQNSDNVISFYVDENFKRNVLIQSKKNKLVLKKNFFQQPYEVVFRSLSDSLRFIGKNYYSVRGKKLDRIINKIEKNRPFKATLGGCIIEKVNQTLIISKEH